MTFHCTELYDSVFTNCDCNRGRVPAAKSYGMSPLCTRERVVRVHFSAWYWVSACYIDVVQFNFPTDTNISPQTILTAHAPSDVVLPTRTPIKPYASTYMYISCQRFFNESSVFFFNYISLLSSVWEYTFYIGMFLRTNYKSTSI